MVGFERQRQRRNDIWRTTNTLMEVLTFFVWQMTLRSSEIKHYDHFPIYMRIVPFRKR
jgi:hypothetical protein